MESRAIQTDPGSASGANAPRQERLPCPRCGYDVSGPVATWTESCPVGGMCSECGLSFRWLDVFHPLRDVPRWFFELAPWRRVWSFPATWARTVLPWRFWRDVKLSFPPRPRRLFAFGAAAAFGMWLFVALMLFLVEGYGARGFYSGGGSVWRGNGWVPVAPTFSWSNLVGLLWANLRWVIPPEKRYWYDGVPMTAGFVVLFLVLTPLGFGCLPETLGRAKVRAWHVVRAAVYSATCAGVLFCTVATLRCVAMWYDYGPRWSRALSWPIRSALGGLTDWLLANEWPMIAPVVPWTLLTWWIVCRRYFRIDHAFWTALAMTAIGTLTTLIPVLLLSEAFTPLLWMFI